MAGERAAPPPPPPPVTILRGHTSGVQGLCFLSEQIVLSGDQNGFVKMWNLERRRVVASFQAHGEGFGIQRLERLDARRLVSQGRDGVIKVWDAERLAAAGGTDVGRGGSTTNSGALGTSSASTAIPHPLFSLPTGAFHFCQFALPRWRDATTMSTAAMAERSHHVGGLHGEATGDEKERSKERRRNTDSSADDSRREEQSQSGQCDPTRTTFEAGGQEEDNEDGWAGKVVSAEESVSDGSFEANTMLAPSHEQHAVTVWDMRAQATAYTITPKDAERKGMVMCVRLLGESSSSASPLGLCGHDHGSLCVYDLRATSAEPLVDVRLHKEPVLSVDVGSSGRQGVSGSADDSIHIFKMNGKKGLCSVAKTFKLEHPGTSCVEIRRDQKLFVTGGWDHRVRVFSWKAPRPLAVLRSHEESVYGVAYSPRIGVFASCSKDCRVAIWDVFPDKTSSSS